MLDCNDETLNLNLTYLLNSAVTALKSKKTNLNDKDRTLNKSDCKEVPLVKVKKTDPNLETENYLRSHILI